VDPGLEVRRLLAGLDGDIGSGRRRRSLTSTPSSTVRSAAGSAGSSVMFDVTVQPTRTLRLTAAASRIGARAGIDAVAVVPRPFLGSSSR